MRNLTNCNLSEDEWEDLDRDLRNIQGCDLGTWDQEFIADMLEKLERFGTGVRISARQWAQLQRLKEQYA